MVAVGAVVASIPQSDDCLELTCLQFGKDGRGDIRFGIYVHHHFPHTAIVDETALNNVLVTSVGAGETIGQSDPR